MEVKSQITLRLQPFKREDVQLYFNWNSDKRVLGPYVEPDHRSIEELLADYDIDQWQTDRIRVWLLVDQIENIMGYAHCWLFDPFETHIELGRILLPEYRGKGIGAEYLQLVIDEVFESTSAHRIQSVTSCKNTAVISNWRSLGQYPEARLKDYMKLNDSYVDCYLFSMFRPQWERQNAVKKNFSSIEVDNKSNQGLSQNNKITRVISTVEDNFIEGNYSERRRMIANIFQESPMFNASLKQVFNRKLKDTDGHRLYDFATQDYLGLDFEPDVVDASIDCTREFGTVVAWCRMVATPEIFNQVERKIASLIGSEACSIFASTTLLNHGVIPALLGDNGVLFLEKTAHATMYEGGKIARDSGARLTSFLPNDIEGLEKLLIEHSSCSKKLIALDGANSMTGDYPDLVRIDKLASNYGALIFVDDAHGFGVLGENPSIEHPYGKRGNGIVKYFGLDYSNILYVGCFSKAYGSYGSFIGCSARMREFFLSQATPHDLGGMGSASAMAAVLAGLKINETEGDIRRDRIYQLVQKLITGLSELGFTTHNKTGFPIISVKLKAAELMVEASKILYKNHILCTLAPYPSVKKGDEAFRLTVTASNTDREIDALISAFAKVKEFLLSKGKEL